MLLEINNVLLLLENQILYHINVLVVLEVVKLKLIVY